MNTLLEKSGAVFLGVADHVEIQQVPFPAGPIDIFQLSQHKFHIVYPGFISSHVWVVLVDGAFLASSDLSKWELRIADEAGNELGKVNFLAYQSPKEGLAIPSTNESMVARHESSEGSPAIPSTNESMVTYMERGSLSFFLFKLDGLVNSPGRYMVHSIYDGVPAEIGSVQFHYQKAQSLTPDQIKAIESDPNSPKSVLVEYGCKLCPSKLAVYTGLKRQPDLEKNKGCIWQYDLPDEFKCECGKTNFSLSYLRESMHGLLLKDFRLENSALSYIRRYGHSQVETCVKEFTTLLDRESLEQPVQDFIESHPILLSRFHSKRLFFRPDILGRFKADFVLVDSRGELVFIELERPSIKLFKTDGHPTAQLMHAYGQVTDWLNQYRLHQGAVLDSLGLKPDEIVGVRGAVIAGRNVGLKQNVIQRHLASPPYPNVEFMTLDDLANSLLNISKKLV